MSFLISYHNLRPNNLNVFKDHSTLIKENICLQQAMNLYYCFQVWLTFNYRYMLNFNIHTIFIQLVKDLPLILTRRIAEHLYFRLFARYIHLLLTFSGFFSPPGSLRLGLFLEMISLMVHL